jgi:hypothetical protein
MISLKFHLEIQNGATYEKHDLFDIEFDIHEHDSEVYKRINDFSYTKRIAEFCYLVFTFIFGRDDLEKNDDRLKYFDKFRFEFNKMHNDSWGLQSYTIFILGLTINGKEWRGGDIMIKSLMEYGWIETPTTAYPRKNGIEITNGYCEYSYAIKELADSTE